MSNVMTDKEEECRGCEYLTLTFGAFPCSGCSEGSRYREEGSIAAQLKEAEKNA